MTQNRMNFKRFLAAATALIIAFQIPLLKADAQDVPGYNYNIENEQILSPKDDLLNTVLPTYTAWRSAELSGKLRMDRLPLTPTVKIYMRKDSLVSISVRAPFVGEVGRIQATRDSIFAVNKMKRVYCEESLGDLRYEYPNFIGDIQALLLGRVVVFKSGPLSARKADFIDINIAQSDSVAIDVKKWEIGFPKNRTVYDQFGYSYIVNGDGRIDNLFAELQTLDIQLAIDFNYPGTQSDMTLLLMKEEIPKFRANILFDAPRWDAIAPAPLKINNKYSQVSVSQFIKSF